MKYSKKNWFYIFLWGHLKRHTISLSNSREHKMQNCKNWDFNVHYTENNWQKLFVGMNCHAIINWYIIHLALLFNSMIRTNRVHNIVWRRTVCLCFNRSVKILAMYRCTHCNRPTDRKQEYLMWKLGKFYFVFCMFPRWMPSLAETCRRNRMIVLRRTLGAVVGLNWRIISNVCNYVGRDIPMLTVLTVKWALKNAAKSHKNAEHNVQNYETHSYPIVDTTKNMKV